MSLEHLTMSACISSFPSCSLEGNCLSTHRLLTGTQNGKQALSCLLPAILQKAFFFHICLLVPKYVTWHCRLNFLPSHCYSLKVIWKPWWSVGAERGVHSERRVVVYGYPQSGKELWGIINSSPSWPCGWIQSCTKKLGSLIKHRPLSKNWRDLRGPFYHWC